MKPIGVCSPGHMSEGVHNSVMHGVPAGGFLMAIFRNDFMGAAGKADSTNLRCLDKLGDVSLQLRSEFVLRIAGKGCGLVGDRWSGWAREKQKARKKPKRKAEWKIGS